MPRPVASLKAAARAIRQLTPNVHGRFVGQGTLSQADGLGLTDPDTLG